MHQPIKRHEALQPWSRDHHHGLLLSWKIKKGFALGVDPLRIKKYTNWFWDTQLKHHFITEEDYLFPILGTENTMVKQALNEHKKLTSLFESEEDLSHTLSEIERLINDHIRFEERVLFNAIQEVATDAELELLRRVHSDSDDCEVWEDEFWK
jgi:iron-sulfur cluster repair protein YtfE (RIC family)